MAPEAGLSADDPGRFQRFQVEFRAQNLMGDAVNDILDHHQTEMKIREEDEHDLSLIVAAALDALILLRSNVNLLIDTRFIVTDQHLTERAREFVAYGLKEHRGAFSNRACVSLLAGLPPTFEP